MCVTVVSCIDHSFASISFQLSILTFDYVFLPVVQYSAGKLYGTYMYFYTAGLHGLINSSRRGLILPLPAPIAHITLYT